MTQVPYWSCFCVAAASQGRRRSRVACRTGDQQEKHRKNRVRFGRGVAWPLGSIKGPDFRLSRSALAPLGPLQPIHCARLASSALSHRSHVHLQGESWQAQAPRSRLCAWDHVQHDYEHKVGHSRLVKPETICFSCHQQGLTSGRSSHPISGVARRGPDRAIFQRDVAGNVDLSRYSTREGSDERSVQMHVTLLGRARLLLCLVMHATTSRFPCVNSIR